MKTIEYKDNTELRKILRLKKVYRWCGDYIWTYIILAMICYVLGSLAWHYQLKILGWC